MLLRYALRKSYHLVIPLLAFSTSILHAHASQSRDEPAKQAPTLNKRLITQQDRIFYKFVTRPDIDAPVFDIEVHKEAEVAPGYWFIAPYGQLGQDRPGQQWDGAHIFDGNGELIWSGTPMFGRWNVFDFETSMVNGETMLTLLSSHEKHAFILDSSYHIYKTVPLLQGKEVKPNMHAFNVFDDGKRALLLTVNPAHATKDASRIVGFDGECFAKYQGFREVDLESPGAEKVLFAWDASDHIGLDEATYRKYDGSIEQQCTRGWDILHLNSITKFPDGDYLLSARHTDAIYKISGRDGSIVWRLGGVKSSFQQDGWAFSRQHHAEVIEQNATHTTVTIFDNGIGDGPFEEATSDHARALIILLDTTNMIADIIGEFKQPKGERTNARGSFQTLPNGNKFICWAYNSYISEHAPDGTLVMEAAIPIKLRSYRAFKHPWIGRPTQPPDVYTEAITLEDRVVTSISVSWNGDTRTHKWEFSEVDDEGTVRRLGLHKREGFETAFEYKGFAAQVFAEALDVDGNKLGKSGVAVTAWPSTLGSDDSLGQDIQGEQPGHPPNTQPGPTNNPADSTSASAMSFLKTNKNFGIGIVCGIAFGAVIWIGLRFCKRWRTKSLRKDQSASYMLLEQDMDR